MTNARDMERSPWICHVCNFKSEVSEGKVCSLCYRTTCPLHLRPASVYNKENGLYETAEVCISCGSSR